MFKKASIFFISSCFYFSGVSSNEHSLHLGNFYIKPVIGTEFAISGDALKSSTYSQTAATTLTFSDGTIVTAGATGTVDVPDVSFNDAYDQPISFGGEVGYEFDNDIDGYFKVNHVSADSKTFIAATATVNATITFGGTSSSYTAGGTLFEGTFSDYSETSFLVGGRKYFNRNKFNFSLGAGLGFSMIGDINLKVIEKISGNNNTETLKFSKDSTVFVGEINGGLNYDIDSDFTLGFDVGYKFKGASERDTTDFNTNNLDTLQSSNDSDGQHVIGILGSLSYRF